MADLARCKTCGRIYMSRDRYAYEDGFGHRVVAGHWPVFDRYVELDELDETGEA
ncbi:hypothetical protein ACFT2C_09185 [Promicromonospora sp. NPDC057138]|uniref:hypothetical protein n=1 Tax=Promicromonospora sp. NPDC057138 TaxID=3346031 RepID=UPI00363A422A